MSHGRRGPTRNRHPTSRPNYFTADVIGSHLRRSNRHRFGGGVTFQIDRLSFCCYSLLKLVSSYFCFFLWCFVLCSLCALPLFLQNFIAGQQGLFNAIIFPGESLLVPLF